MSFVVEYFCSLFIIYLFVIHTLCLFSGSIHTMMCCLIIFMIIITADTMASPSHGRLVCEQCLMEHGRTQGLFLYGCFLPYLHENTSRLVIPTNGPRGPSNIPAKSRVTKQQEYVRPVPSIPVFHFRLCKFLPPQVCRWGDKCTFPHSSVELRAWNDAKRRITDGMHNINNLCNIIMYLLVNRG